MPNSLKQNSFAAWSFNPWSLAGEDVVAPTVGTLRFKLPPNKNVFTLPARMQKFPLPANENEFILKEGGQS